jgi:hypothetical protein
MLGYQNRENYLGIGSGEVCQTEDFTEKAEGRNAHSCSPAWINAAKSVPSIEVNQLPSRTLSGER